MSGNSNLVISIACCREALVESIKASRGLIERLSKLSRITRKERSKAIHYAKYSKRKRIRNKYKKLLGLHKAKGLMVN